MSSIDEELADEIKIFQRRLFHLKARAEKELEAINIAIENTELKLEKAEKTVLELRNQNKPEETKPEEIFVDGEKK